MCRGKWGQDTESLQSHPQGLEGVHSNGMKGMGKQRAWEINSISLSGIRTRERAEALS